MKKPLRSLFKNLFALILMIILVIILGYGAFLLLKTEVFALTLLKGTSATLIIFGYLGFAVLIMFIILLATRRPSHKKKLP